MKRKIIINLVLLTIAATVTACSASDDSTAMMWVEKGTKQAIDKENSCFIGISYKEVDLSILGYNSNWGYEESFREIGFDFKIPNYSTDITQNKTTTRDEVVNVGNNILNDMQERGYFPKYELMLVRYDENQNIWILTFWENNINQLGSDFNIAINGDTSEIIRMWVME